MRLAAKLTIALTVLALLSLTGCGKLKARDELNKGVRAYKAAQYETAIEHFQRSIELDPTLLNARLYLATAYAAQFVPQNPSQENLQRGEAAIREFKKVLELHPGNVNALSNIASLYYGMAGAMAANDWEEAQKQFEKSKEFRRQLTEVDPRNPEHYYSIGVIDWTVAYRRNKEVRGDLKLSEDVPLPRRARQSLAEQNRAVVEEGIDALQKALELNPKYLEAIAYLNLMYRQKADIVGSPQEREQYLQAAEDMFERHKRLREEIERASAPIPAA